MGGVVATVGLHRRAEVDDFEDFVAGEGSDGEEIFHGEGGLAPIVVAEENTNTNTSLNRR